MTEYLTEQEQIEQLKTWIKQYGLTILFGIVIALVLSFSWHYWQQYRAARQRPQRRIQDREGYAHCANAHPASTPPANQGSRGTRCHTSWRWWFWEYWIALTRERPETK